ncbi:MAG: nucleoside hydrolase [Anaerolineae bacterium]
MPLVHLDTDIGGDIDDLCALAMLLSLPEVELAAVTTNSDDGGIRAGMARYVLDLAGRGSVPVAAGADIALGCYAPTPGLPDEALYWPEPITPAPAPLDRALGLLDASIERGAHVVAIGALTNLALLETRSPGILAQAKLTLVGGYVYPVRVGYPLWGNDMDWNVQVDPRSAQTVLERSEPTLVPLTVTVETYLRRADLEPLRRSGPLGALIARQAGPHAAENRTEELYGRTCAGLPEDTIAFLHDPLACAIALGWREGVEMREVPLRWELRDGLLWHRIEAGGKPTRVVTRVDGAALNAYWLRTITGAGKAV